jgi:hypothetical protein
MKVSQVLGVVVVAGLVSTQPGLSAVGKKSSSDPEAIYTLRVDTSKSKRVRFQLIEPRGDSIVEADQFEFVVTPRGLIVRPTAPTAASSTFGSRLTFESFELFLPSDGSPSLLEGSVSKSVEGPVAK